MLLLYKNGWNMYIMYLIVYIYVFMNLILKEIDFYEILINFEIFFYF